MVVVVVGNELCHNLHELGHHILHVVVVVALFLVVVVLGVAMGRHLSGENRQVLDR